MSGARRIFLYNWPLFVGTWLAAIAAGGFAFVYQQWLLAVAAGLALACSGAALAVASYLYDVSPLSGGAWITALIQHPIHTWAAVDAGLDAEVSLEPNLGGSCVARLELRDPQTMRGGSIRRARSLTARRHTGIQCTPTALPLGDAACDAVFVVFAAHEIQERAARERFFSELARALKPRGTLLLVEHVRDVWNFAAFGPGAFHFFARAEWLSLAAHTGFRVRTETRVTPWVMVLALEAPG